MAIEILQKRVKLLMSMVCLSFKEKRFGKLKYIYEQNELDALIVVFAWNRAQNTTICVKDQLIEESPLGNPIGTSA